MEFKFTVNNSTNSDVENEATSKMPKPCIICYRPWQHNEGGLHKQGPILKRFFRLFGKHLQDGNKFAYDKDCEENAQAHLDNLVNAGMLSCEYCFKTVESFCDLYYQMKALELRVNWKVEVLKNMMLAAERVPDRIQDFESCAEQHDIGFERDASEAVNSVLDFKRHLREQCNLKLRMTCPRLTLHKCKLIVETPDLPSCLRMNATTTIKMENNSAEEKCRFAYDDDDFQENLEVSHHISSPELDIGPTEMKMEADPAAEKARLKSDDDFDPDDYLEASDMNGDTSECENESEPESIEHLEIEFIDQDPEEETNRINPATGKHKCIRCSREFRYLETFIAHYKAAHLTKYKCTLCEIKYSYRRDFNLHQQNVHTGPQFRCPSCKKRFKNQSSLNEHNPLECETRRGKHSCDHCEERFTTSETLKRHVKNIHLEVKSHTCEICGKEYSRKDILQSHMKKAHAIPTNKCDYCEEAFSKRHELQLHLKTVHPKPEKPSVCDTCGKSFALASQLREHTQSVHLKSRKHVCKTCGKGFFTNSKLKVHLTTIHLKSERHACDSCGKVFQNKSYLQKHMKSTHLKSGNFPCGDCGSVFTLQEALVRHQQRSCTVTVARDFACDQCDKTFTSSDNLKIHVKRNHLELQKHKCDICKKVYNRRDIMLRHMRKDHDVVPRSKCDICEEDFDTRHQLQLHVKTDHSTIQESHKCETCGKSYSSRKNLRKHMKVHGVRSVT